MDGLAVTEEVLAVVMWVYVGVAVMIGVGAVFRLVLVAVASSIPGEQRAGHSWTKEVARSLRWIAVAVGLGGLGELAVRQGDVSPDVQLWLLLSVVGIAGAELIVDIVVRGGKAIGSFARFVGGKD
ncbi:hypothetical protein [Nesterenkonia sp. K-15-9-6]|uniref:hypothetical protein n=1 Tax=Nesterenkonia sp. K-15-9-6 TaxID=3093918 RepID=UPI004044A5C5